MPPLDDDTLGVGLLLFTTTAAELPVPLDQPVTGADLLAVINYLLDPLATVTTRVDVGQVAAVTPSLTVTVTWRGQTMTLPAVCVPGYTPAVGDQVTVLASLVQVVIAGAA